MRPISPVFGGVLALLACTTCNAQDYYRDAAVSMGGYGGAVAGTYCCGPAGGYVGAGVGAAGAGYIYDHPAGPSTFGPTYQSTPRYVASPGVSYYGPSYGTAAPTFAGRPSMGFGGGFRRR